MAKTDIIADEIESDNDGDGLNDDATATAKNSPQARRTLEDYMMRKALRNQIADPFKDDYGDLDDTGW
jgi:hypothetical protein